MIDFNKLENDLKSHTNNLQAFSRAENDTTDGVF